MIPGVNFAGEGSEVQSIDPDTDMPGKYEGDMEAALALAKATQYRFLVYVPEVDLEDSYHPWEVLAWSTPARALACAEAVGGWSFDGRTETPLSHPSGIGYLHPTTP